MYFLTKNFGYFKYLYYICKWKMSTKQYSTSKNFDYEMFYNWCRAMKEDGHTVFVSEYQMPSDFKCIWQKEVTNAMNLTSTKKPIEKLFTL